MTCDTCRNVDEAPADAPHVVRTCEECGREMRVVERVEHGKGITVQEGDRFVIPSGWLKLAANPLKGTGRLTRAGLEWFAKLIFVNDLTSKESQYVDEAEILEEELGDFVNESSLISPLKVGDEEDIDEITEILQDNPNTAEYWAFWTGAFLAAARQARQEGDAERASWATACAERCHAMVVFKRHLEEVVWMGHSAQRIVNVLRIWDQNRDQDKEAFWQETFNEHSYVLSQVFAVPVVFIEEQAFVGGMSIDRTGGKLTDYLLATESSRESILVEIKPPTMSLLGGTYRGTYPPSAKLSGAITQVLTQRDELVQELDSLRRKSGEDLEAFKPKCVVIAGNADQELDDPLQRRSFELFRASLDVTLVTYDELFRKVEILAKLFSIKRTEGPAPDEHAE